MNSTPMPFLRYACFPNLLVFCARVSTRVRFGSDYLIIVPAKSSGIGGERDHGRRYEARLRWWVAPEHGTYPRSGLAKTLCT